MNSMQRNYSEEKMISLTSDFESDSFLSEISLTEENEEKSEVNHFRRVLEMQGEKLNQMTTNNRELLNVQSQLARLRSELEKSEMLRQTLEYELTILRTQHGKQNASQQHLQQQFDQANEQIQQLQSEFKLVLHQKDHQIMEKEKKIQQLQSEAETLHERERRIELLNDQIQKMEKTFSDSESISRKNLAQSILAKERQNQFEKEFEVVQMKLQYNEQALEQEKSISNEAKLNVQLLSTRLNQFEEENETLKKNLIAEERKVGELERQCSNEKLLRSTLSKLQSDIETKCAETQKLIIDYEKQLKINREELANFRRKFRNNEEKYSLCIQKIFELLRLTRIVNDSTNHSQDNSLPTLKQLEELKLYIEQAKTNKIELNNEINRLKKSFDRLNKTHLTQKQIEQEFEMNKEKVQIELEELKESQSVLEEDLKICKLEKENFFKELENKSSLLLLIHQKIRKFLGTNLSSPPLSSSSSIENDFQQLEKQFNSLLNKSKLLEEKLIERDTGTLQLTQKLEEQVLHLKEDFHQKHFLALKQKDQQLQIHLQQIQQLNLQLEKMEERIHQSEEFLHKENEKKRNFNEQNEKIFLIFKHFISLWFPLRQRYFQLIQSNRFLKQQFSRLEQIQLYFPRKFQAKFRFRIFVLTILASKRFLSLGKHSSFVSLPTISIVYDQNILQTIDEQFLHSIQLNDLFSSILFQLNRLQPLIHYKGSLIQSIFPLKSSTNHSLQCFDQIHRLIVRLEECESRLMSKEIEVENVSQKLCRMEKDVENRVDYFQFERICDELQRALNREKQAQDLLNEQNHQLKSLTEILHQTQQEKDFLQDKFHQSNKNDRFHQDKIQQLNKSQQQMEENVKRAEKAIRLVVNDKEQISSFCHRINSALNYSEKLNLENLFQLIIQLDALVQLPATNEEFNQKLSPELILSQTMAKGFLHLLNRLKDEIGKNEKDLHCLKEHCQMLTDQFRQMSLEEHSTSQIDSQSTILPQTQPIRLQVNHHPQSAFKPIKPQFQ